MSSLVHNSYVCINICEKCTQLLGINTKKCPKNHFWMLIYGFFPYSCNLSLRLKEELKCKSLCNFETFIISTCYSSGRKIQII